MVVAARATDRHSQKRLAGRAEDIVQVVVPRERPVGRFVVPDSQTIKTGSRNAVARLVRQLVAGQLFEHKSIVWLVLVEGANHVVAVLPDEVLAAVAFVAVGFGVANQIEPMPGPLLAVLRRFE